MTDDDLRRALVSYARQAYHRCLVAGTGGNASARLDGERMLITATAMRLDQTDLDNLVTVRLHDATVEGDAALRPSKESGFHAAIYLRRPDVGAVLHAHPPHATAYAVHRRDIPMVTDAAFKQPPIPRVPFAPSGSAGLRDGVGRAIAENPGCRALLLEEHGLVALGLGDGAAAVASAYGYADLVEELARIAFLAETLGAGDQRRPTGGST